MTDEVARTHVQTVLVRAGEWVTVEHGLNTPHAVMTTYTLDGLSIYTTSEHVDHNTITLTLGGWTYHGIPNGEDYLSWSNARGDHYVRVVVLG